MKNVVELKERPVVLKAFRKPKAKMYHQYRINGKRATYGEYMKKRMMALYNEPYVKRYVTFTKSGSIVEVDSF